MPTIFMDCSLAAQTLDSVSSSRVMPTCRATFWCEVCLLCRPRFQCLDKFALFSRNLLCSFWISLGQVSPPGCRCWWIRWIPFWSDHLHMPGLLRPSFLLFRCWRSRCCHIRLCGFVFAEASGTRGLPRWGAWVCFWSAEQCWWRSVSRPLESFAQRSSCLKRHVSPPSGVTDMEVSVSELVLGQGFNQGIYSRVTPYRFEARWLSVFYLVLV